MKPKVSNARRTTVPESRVFWENIERLKGIHNLTDNDVAHMMKRNIGTIYNRKAHPESTEFRDIYNIALYFGIEPAARLLMPMSEEEISTLSTRCITKKASFPEARIFWRNVEYLKAVHGVFDKDVASALMRSVGTLHNRKTDPETTNLRDLYNAALYFGIGSAAGLLVPMTVTQTFISL